MLREDLLDVVNSGEAWAFLGAGASMDAGGPSWARLLELVVQASGDPTIGKDAQYLRALASEDYIQCFTVLERILGRFELEDQVKRSLVGLRQPGRLIRTIADLPFRGYLTTNYDNLLERALESDPGWVAVGNTHSEIRKVSGGGGRMVWHIHGAVGLDESKSKLVLTQSDYDETYVDGSPVMKQMLGLLSQHRVVFIGFGFQDHDVVQQLRRVGRLTDPSRPIFAFMPSVAPVRRSTDRRDFLRNNNVDIEPYHAHGGNHRELQELLDVYASLSLRRSLRFGKTSGAVPSYDPETTSLLMYNELIGREQIGVDASTRQSLLQARVLEVIASRPRSSAELAQDVSDLATQLARGVDNSAVEGDPLVSVNRAVEELMNLGYVVPDTSQDPKRILLLTESGRTTVMAQRSRAELLGDQFRASLLARSRRATKDDEIATRIASAAEGFFAECISRRALGVAMALFAGRRSAQHDYHMLALLQSLRSHLETLRDVTEASLLLSLVRETMRAPTHSEAVYIGITLQARFGMHMLGYDENALSARLNDLKSTVFLLDSTTTIPLLARSSRAHAAANEMVTRLQALGCPVIATELLLQEASEHARWAQRREYEAAGDMTILIEAALGRYGQRTNAFLEGFLAEVNEGSFPMDFGRYMASLFRDTPAKEVRDREVGIALARHGVKVLSLGDFQGDIAAAKRTKDGYFSEIERQRREGATLTHERQVEAEAEACSIIEGLRSSSIGIPSTHSGGNALFLSYSHFLDGLVGIDMPVTIRPESVMHWINTTAIFKESDATALYDALIWELQERKFDLVDQATIRTVFHPAIDASKRGFKTELQRHRALMAEHTGTQVAGGSVRDVDMPTVRASAAAQRAAVLERQLLERDKAISELKSGTTLSTSEYEEYQRLKKKERGAKRAARIRERKGRGPKGKGKRHGR